MSFIFRSHHESVNAGWKLIRCADVQLYLVLTFAEPVTFC